jgi:cytochrome b subunit of formate dehydrogenase
MLIRPRDFTEFFADAMFSLGVLNWLSRRRFAKAVFERHPALRFDRRPCASRYGLVEKLEYGGVLWGNVVMIATGAILWRPDWFLGWTPRWTFEVCRVVHGFEATLAFLAIIIWHMYHVHVRPGAFNRVWLNGRISRDALRHHHPAEYLRILERRAASAKAPERELAKVK